MNVLNILTYLPAMMQILALIQQAETQFAGKGTGAQKLAWVTSQVIQLCQSNGLLNNIIKGDPNKSALLVGDIVKLITDMSA